jgi:hypothetical protein
MSKKSIVILLSLILIFLTSVITQIALMLQRNIFLIILVMVVGFVFICPLVSFLFSKKLISNGSKKLLLSVLCPLTVTLSYLVFYFMEGETYLLAGILFAWCELWSLLGLIRIKKKEQ